ncbi:hypothetical protein AVEN_185986-1 [Araneus ventricosus]|uniref:Uncharacterized protein n=1 Tax=Araneus ventricosus TaxID=182803 RepID=A0A4Y2K828_ARAVE|nr:hypothetical protein AVEN_185986-1 [Araneus ventricosus]
MTWRSNGTERHTATESADGHGKRSNRTERHTATVSVGWTWKKHGQGTPNPFPEVITATVPVGWTWGKQRTKAIQILYQLDGFMEEATGQNDITPSRKPLQPIAYQWMTGGSYGQKRHTATGISWMQTIGRSNGAERHTHFLKAITATATTDGHGRSNGAECHTAHCISWMDMGRS